MNQLLNPGQSNDRAPLQPDSGVWLYGPGQRNERAPLLLPIWPYGPGQR